HRRRLGRGGGVRAGAAPPVSGRRGAAGVAAALTAAIVGITVLAGAAPAGAGAANQAPAAKVLVVSVPRLQWDAVPAAPALTALFERGAVASLSIRTADAVSTLDDGYLTIGAGNRASLPTSAPPGATDQPGGGVVVDGATVAAALAD